jgi:hypothetical protein
MPRYRSSQRAWLGFRTAIFSRERDDATLPKIWTLFASLRARSPVEPGDMEYFKPVDVPPAIDKVPPPTPWS